MTSRPTLIVMAKAPRLGQGKSRLARDMGRVEALRINRALHAMTMRAALDPRWRTIWRVTPDRDVGLVLPAVWPCPFTPSPPGEGAGGGVKRNLYKLERDAQCRSERGFSATIAEGVTRANLRSVEPHPAPFPWRGGGVSRQPQGEGDLGSRLARVLSPHRRVAVVGTDCPAMTRAHVAAAFRALRHKPFAIGPARDGGFWILAARDGKAAAAAMKGVRWSSPHAGADVISALGSRNVARLATVGDIDTLADWRAYRSAMRPSRGA